LELLWLCSLPAESEAALRQLTGVIHLALSVCQHFSKTSVLRHLIGPLRSLCVDLPLDPGHSDLVTLGAVRGLLRFEAEYVKDEEPGFCHALHALLPRLRIKFRASNLVTPSWGMH
jgi:hypothetical protein